MADPRQRQLKIKAGVVKRIAKETTMYKLELTQQEEKVEKMKTGGDEYMLKKQIEVLQEAKMMIPDCERRLAAAHGDLSQLVRREAEQTCVCALHGAGERARPGGHGRVPGRRRHTEGSQAGVQMILN
ncbi:unnamed protein product [Lampetra planeri]